MDDLNIRNLDFVVLRVAENMVASKLSDCFKINFVHLKIFGIWPGGRPVKYYKYYSAIFVLFNLIIYNTLLIVNLLYTPRKIELLIREVIFLFTEVTVTGKAFMIILMRKKLLAAFDVLDCKAFEGEDDVGRQIVERHVTKYRSCWKLYAVLSNFAYTSQVFLPIIVYLIFNTNMELPICKYYFLDDGIVHKYFTLWFIYQSFGMYGHMQYNVNIDTLINGLLLMAISQLKILKHELANLKVVKNKRMRDFKEDMTQILKLNKYLRHYETLLAYCKMVQDIIGVTMFIQFGMASIIICVVLCGLLLPSSIETLMFMVSYLLVMVLQIFVPAWLGTQLKYESQELVFAAYSSEWIPRSERFKRSLKLFMKRANTNIVITGWRIFPLSLDTFISILKSAYSFFTLIRNVQDREVQ